MLASENCDEFSGSLRSCEAYSISAGQGEEDYLVDVTYRFQFRSEQRAESQALDIEDLIDDQNWDLDLDEVKADGTSVEARLSGGRRGLPHGLAGQLLGRKNAATSSDSGTGADKTTDSDTTCQLAAKRAADAYKGVGFLFNADPGSGGGSNSSSAHPGAYGHHRPGTHV